jgi:hypothetical protein
MNNTGKLALFSNANGSSLFSDVSATKAKINPSDRVGGGLVLQSGTGALSNSSYIQLS